MAERASLVPLHSNLPPCWWVACRYSDGLLELRASFNTRAAAEEEAERTRESSHQWLHKPSRIDAMEEDADLRCPRRGAGAISSRSQVAACWNWYQRNFDLLTGAAEPKTCRVLVHTCEQPNESPVLLSNRIGGAAVLPDEMPWPIIELEPWDDGRWERMQSSARNLGLPLERSEPFPGGPTFATYLGTYDLRGCFDFGNGFPDGISIFLSTYDESSDTYSADSANCFFPYGVVVPFYEEDDLVLRSPPPGVPELPYCPLEEWELPDFPEYAYEVPLKRPERTGIFGRRAPQRRRAATSFPMEPIYDEIERLEPGTSEWINIGGSKIGGYPYFQQGDPTAMLGRRERRIDWQFIGTWDGPLELGDAGTLYLLAGWDPTTMQWRWRCEWQCG